jgi:hypothetical protein
MFHRGIKFRAQQITANDSHIQAMNRIAAPCDP